MARWQNRSPLTAFRIILDPSLILRVNEKCLSRTVCAMVHTSFKKWQYYFCTCRASLWHTSAIILGNHTNPCVVCSYSWSITCSALAATFSAVSDPSNHLQLSLEYTLDQLPPPHTPTPLTLVAVTIDLYDPFCTTCPAAEQVFIIQKCMFQVSARQMKNRERNPPLKLLQRCTITTSLVGMRKWLRWFMRWHNCCRLT